MANELIPLTDWTLSGGALFGLIAAAVFLLFAVVWAVHVKIEDAGVVDFFWGGGFVLIGWLGVLASGQVGAVTLLGVGLVSIWAVRLTAHMVGRHKHMGGEDARYAAMRRRGGPSFWWVSFFTIYCLQATIQLIVATPILVLILAAPQEAPLALVVSGVGLFVVGLALETVADIQLWSFKGRPENRGRLMTGGLFRYSRHPNYFGETLLWWGLGLIGYAGSGALTSFVGPLLLTVLLLKVSGVAMLDAHLSETKPGYAEWAARTSAFIPLPPRRDPIGDREAAE